ncbi:potassium transporter TrkH [Sneathiella sp. P13V-1]|uniref:TrkH family potassium uptake protein n=1 Tax=Sneathiella sp. P13V-1 TaxID=2697366 RepID=UPI00187B9D64|nr:TrkH family potassium uptake protein [Sneathiella sp. P13V-1]MBE7637655.1 potassium transporter TrkH [Sneathiella sp. P13V-1]
MRPILFVNGAVLSIISLPLLLIETLNRGADLPFLKAFTVIIFVGVGLMLAARGGQVNFSHKQIFILTASIWLVLTSAATLPFYMYGMPLADAVFEATSGITTTGATVLEGMDYLPHSLLMWRAFLQWLGGIGIVVTAIAMLPFLGIGGMQLFRTESSESSEKELPSAAKLASTTLWVYIGLTVACAMAYLVEGMTVFDAIAHSFTTVATGGFSTHDASIGYFQNHWIYWTCILFMFLGSVPFLWYIRAIRVRRFNSEQLKLYSISLVIIITMLVLWLVFRKDFTFYDALLHATFSVISVVTTSGFGISDYSAWGGFSALLFFFLIFSGGCTGSTTGGIKVLRFIISAKMIRQIIRKQVFPNGIFAEKYEGKKIETGVFTGVASFVFVFIATFAVFAVILMALGMDFKSAVSGSAAAITNVGPGIGNIIGPAGNFADIPTAAKWILSLEMILGRLEIFTLLIFLTPRFWRE